LEKAAQLVQKAMVLSQAHLPTHIVQGLSVLARLQILKGNLLKAEVTIQEGHNNPYRESWGVFYLPVLLAEAELAIDTGHHSKALAATEALVTRLHSYGMRLYLPEALYLQGKSLLGLGQDCDAYDCFSEAHRVAETTGSRRMVWRILVALSQLEKDPAKADSLFQEARQVVEFILEQFKSEHANLRESFSTQEDVRELIEE
jgi:hypothetical protein